MSFQQLQLDSKILQAIAACGYINPTPIQEKCIPVILDGKDVIASSQTGTGKTAAYVLPALHRLCTNTSNGLHNITVPQKNSDKNDQHNQHNNKHSKNDKYAKNDKHKPQTTHIKPRVLVLAPTRELVCQITDVINKYGKFLRFNTVCIVGGVSYTQQLKGLAGKADIIIATPGRLLDHLQNKRVDLSHIEVLILDEADRMLDMGFIDDIKEIAKTTPQHRQTLLFSATIDERLASVARQLLRQPIKIETATTTAEKNVSRIPSLIEQTVHIANDAAHKKQVLHNLLDENNIFKAIIFSATKRNATKLALQLRERGHTALAMHGDLKQSVRNKTLTQLRRGKIQYLVATDVAARGIDVMDISHIINYDLPKTPEDYVHRIGRTGRAGESGRAMSLAISSDLRQLQRIERYIGKKIKRVK